MTITSVEKVKDKKMMRIYIDNHYAFTIPEEEYIRNHLYEEESITEEKLSHIKQNVLVNAAREQAVRYLTIRDRSEAELIKKLVSAGYDPEIARITADSLKAIGYIDDEIYAMKYLSERLKTKALSKKAIRFELQQKGIDKETIEKVLSEYEADDEEVALRAAKKKFGKYNPKDPVVEKKIMSFLHHRGFSFEIGKSVIKMMAEDS